MAGAGLAAILIAFGGTAAGQEAEEDAVKAAFLYNFAKFTEWPALGVDAPIVVCVVGHEGIAAAFVQTVRGQKIEGHALETRQPKDSTGWPSCQVLFLAATQAPLPEGGLRGVRTLPVLTVSDQRGFSREGGIVELYVDGGRVRFVINVDAAERSRLRLSSRLLNLARVVRDGDRS